MTWETAQMKSERLNGVRLRADRENRSVANMLDTILQDAGVPELTDKELEKKLKEKEVAA
jgi:hypothetical protein